jgi:excisionase family DNA binding protein
MPESRPIRAHDVLLLSETTRLLTIADVAQWLGVSKAWVYDHVTRKQPRLPCIRLGEMTRFRAEDIEKFIQEHSSGSH